MIQVALPKGRLGEKAYETLAAAAAMAAPCRAHCASARHAHSAICSANWLRSSGDCSPYAAKNSEQVCQRRSGGTWWSKPHRREAMSK